MEDMNKNGEKLSLSNELSNTDVNAGESAEEISAEIAEKISAEIAEKVSAESSEEISAESSEEISAESSGEPVEEKSEIFNTQKIQLSADEINIPASELDRMAEPSEFTAADKRLKKRRIIMVAVAAAIIILLGAVAAAVYNVYFYNKVYKGVFVSDLDFSGATKREVLASLTDKYEGKIPGDTLSITIGDNEYDFDISKNVSYDLRTTADNVVFYGRQGSFFRRLGDIIEARRFGSEVPVSYSANEEGLEAQIQVIATEIKQDISQSGWQIEGDKLLLDRGQSGLFLDVKELLTFIKNRLYNGDLSPAVFELEQDKTEELDITAIKAAIETEKREPTLDLEADPTGKTILPGNPGIYLDLQKANAILSAAPETQRIIEIPLELTMPDISDEAYKSLLFEDKLASCVTPFTSSADRTNNVILASEAVNGTILLPGDTFSYNATVGERTKARGFKDAIIYVGTTAEAGLGGGVCQISSALYYSALRADLEIVERYAHSRTVTYVPLGEDATVAWGSKDFKFKNNGDYPIRIVAYHNKSNVTVELWGTNTTPKKEVSIETKVISRTPFQTVYQDDASLPAGTEKVKSSGYTGYVTESYRVIKINGKEVSRTFENKSVYGKFDKVILKNPAVVAPVDPTPDDTGTQTDPVPVNPDTQTGPTPDDTPDGDNGAQDTENTENTEDPASPTNLF